MPLKSSRLCDVQAMFRGGTPGSKSRDEFVGDCAEIFISKVTVLCVFVEHFLDVIIN
jgi:hypothetical protein